MESFSQSMNELFEENDPQELPLSTEDMRSEADRWSLQSDTRLLCSMQSFREELENKAEKMQKDINRLAYDTKMKSVQVKNLINEFQMLENSQFIENRVYDEEVDDVVGSRVQLSDESQTLETSEQDIKANIKECLEYGFKFLEDVYPGLSNVKDVALDSEEEEDLLTSNLASMFKDNKYNKVPLPHIIGSEEYVNTPFLSIPGEEADTVDAEAVNERNEYNSDTSSAEDDEFARPLLAKPNRDLTNLMNDILPESVNHYPTMSAEETVDDEIFYVGPTPSLPPARPEMESVDALQVNQSNDELINANSVADVQRKLNLENILQPAASTQKNFGNLFDDIDEDEEDIFKPQAKTEVSKRPSQISSILKQPDGDIFAVEKASTTKTDSKPKPFQANGDDLFSESDGLFDNSAKVPAALKPENYLSFLSDDEDDIFASKGITIDTKAITYDTPSKSPLRVTDNEDDIFTKTIGRSSAGEEVHSNSSHSSTQDLSTPSKSKQPPRKLSLFVDSDDDDDDDDSDIFSSKFTLKKEKPKSILTGVQTDGDLFALPAAKTAKQLAEKKEPTTLSTISRPEKSTTVPKVPSEHEEVDQPKSNVSKTTKSITRLDAKTIGNLSELKDELNKKLAVKMPPVRKEVTTPVCSTLNNDMVKSRPKPNLKRRNPSRKPQKQATDAPEEHKHEAEIKDQANAADTERTSNLPVPSSISLIKSPSTEEEDFFQSPTFGDGEDLFSSVASQNSTLDLVSNRKTGIPGSLNSNLFTATDTAKPAAFDESDDENDIFFSTESSRSVRVSPPETPTLSKPIPPPESKKPSGKASSSRSFLLSDSDDEDIFSSKNSKGQSSESVPKKDNPQAGASIKPSSAKPVISLKPDVLENSIDKVASVKSGPKNTLKKAPSLFGDSDDEDLFSKASKPLVASKKEATKKQVTKSALPEDEEDNLFSSFSQKAKRGNKLKMFSSEDDDEDIFSPKASAQKKDTVQSDLSGEDDLFARR